MVNAIDEAVLLKCDVPMIRFILHVDEEEKKKGSESFIIRQLDSTHLYVKVRARSPLSNPTHISRRLTIRMRVLTIRRIRRIRII